MKKITKAERLAALDRVLVRFETEADALGFDIDAMPEYVELCAIAVAYEWNERRHSARLTAQINDLILAIDWVLFVRWAELRHAGRL